MPLANAPTRITAMLNFAGDRKDGGIWSNRTPDIITQKLEALPIGFQDARDLAVPPSLDVEGFQLIDAPLGGYNWTDQDWVTGEYLPHCAALVKKLTGAVHTAPIHNSVLIRDTAETGDILRAPAAQFVHIDQDRPTGAIMVNAALGAGSATRYGHAIILNIWRTLTPPPQDVPLALCDQRTLDEADWVVGKTIEPYMPDPTPYLSSVHNPRQRWHYFSDMTTGEALVFKNYDSRNGEPLGCLHGAFTLPGAPANTIPRASAETRIAAYFD